MMPDEFLILAIAVTVVYGRYLLPLGRSVMQEVRR